MRSRRSDSRDGVLNLVEAPQIVMVFVSLHRYARPSRRSFSLAAFGLVVVQRVLVASHGKRCRAPVALSRCP